MMSINYSLGFVYKLQLRHNYEWHHIHVSLFLTHMLFMTPCFTLFILLDVSIYLKTMDGAFHK